MSSNFTLLGSDSQSVGKTLFGAPEMHIIAWNDTFRALVGSGSLCIIIMYKNFGKFIEPQLPHQM